MAAAEQAGLANFVPTPDGFEALVPAGGGSTVQVSGKSFALRTVAWSSGPIAAYGGLSGTVGVTPSSSGAKVTNAGRRLAPARSGGRGPVTKIKIRRAGKRVLLNATAHDASGSTTTYYRLGTGDARRWRGTLRLTPTAARTLRYFSIDRLGNREVERKLRLR